MNRRKFLHAAAVGAACTLPWSRSGRAAPAGRSKRKPNLIVFLPDQQRADTLASYGTGKCHAPNLNKLGAQSVVFDRCYVTHPVCTPSRSSLLTGTWPFINGCTHNNMALAPQWKAFPEMLADSDYRTAYMGKWHLGDEVFAQHGFEEWVSIEDQYQKYFSLGRDRKTLSDYSNFLLSHGLKPDRPDGSFSREFASTLPIDLSKPRLLQTRACEFLERHQRDPFVLFVSFLEPHSPYNGPLNNEHRLDEVELESTAWDNFGPDVPLRYRLKQEMQHGKEGGSTPEEYRATKQRYLGNVTAIDRAIGAMLTKLEELRLAENTIVVHTSDHGDMMGAHQLFGKEVMFEPAARVPYFVRLPGQTRQIRVTQPVSHIDFVPTMLDLLGAPAHPQCAGRSNAPLLRGETIPAESVFLDWEPNTDKVKKGTKLGTEAEIQRAVGESTRAVVSPDAWKLCLRDTDKSELYNLRADPLEKENLFGRAAQAAVQKQLTAEIHAWQQRVGDKLALA